MGIRYITAFLLMAASGCALTEQPYAGYQTVKVDDRRDTAKARELAEAALQAIENGQPSKAERLLHDSLIADVKFAPAHNNLGKLYFDRRDFYQAAWEFQYAHELVPDSPEPLINLGLLYESVGRLQQAQDFYRQAFSIDHSNVDALGNLARSIYRSNERSPELAGYLRELLLLDRRSPWVAWAEDILARNFTFEDRQESFVDDVYLEDFEEGSYLQSPTFQTESELLPPPNIPAERSDTSSIDAVSDGRPVSFQLVIPSTESLKRLPAQPNP